MNIFKSFEIFLREPLSIIRKKVIQIVNVNSHMLAQPSVSVDMLEHKTQITVMNSEKMYNLFQTVLQKQGVKSAQNLIEASQRKQVVIGQLCKRM